MSLLKNSDMQYSSAAKWLHWLTAIAVVFLFASGLWMVGLDYYHKWYQRAPNLHMSIGVLLALLTMVRLIYRSIYPYPRPVGATFGLRLVAKVVHVSLYLFLFVLFITGYFVVTAKGENLSVFGFFELPALIQSEDNLQDKVGNIHEWVAFMLIGLASVHGCAALWHHFVRRDNTLLRMVYKAKAESRL